MAWAGLGRRIAVSAVPADAPGGGGSQAQLFMLEVPGPYGEDCPALCPETPLSIPVEHPVAESGPLLAGWSPNVESIALWTAPTNGATLGVVSPRGGGTTPTAGTPRPAPWGADEHPRRPRPTSPPTCRPTSPSSCIRSPRRNPARAPDP